MDPFIAMVAFWAFFMLVGVVAERGWHPQHLPRLPKFESRRVKDHRRCLASIARLERELGMESTEQLRETLFGYNAKPYREVTDEPGQVIQMPSPKPHISTLAGQQVQWEPDGRGKSVRQLDPANPFAVSAYLARRSLDESSESSDDLEVF
jgi:hypothetical protein